ncbi:hypothetical protein [Moorena producens]|uniref:hypothetical protein n=1 Tax=Moorena producens TaxID=1155739 RepID=UPI001314B7D1|nr:hypothetical protein [Moorena producens]
MYFDTYFDEFIRSDAARSWGGSAVLGRQRLHVGVSPETKPDYVEPLWLVGYAEKG